MKLSDYQHEFIKNLISFFDFLIYTKKLKITATWLGRDKEIQEILFKLGLSKTKDSNHMKNLAIDLNIFVGKRIITNLKKKDLTKKELELMEEISVFWENLDPLNRAGFFFKSIYDPGHFEKNV